MALQESRVPSSSYSCNGDFLVPRFVEISDGGEVMVGNLCTRREETD